MSATALKPPATAQDFPTIEPWDNQYKDRDYLITIHVPEFTSVCPKTGLPDFGTWTIQYIPGDKVIELKAFKYYMLVYRNVGIFYENAGNQILNHIVDAIDPKWVRLHGDFSARGGISTEVEIIHTQKGYTKPADLPSTNFLGNEG